MQSKSELNYLYLYAYDILANAIMPTTFATTVKALWKQTIRDFYSIGKYISGKYV